jgi:hypothetical protein
MTSILEEAKAKEFNPEPVPWKISSARCDFQLNIHFPIERPA